MQCKDIPDHPILEFLKSCNGEWATWGRGYVMPTVQDAMPPGTPPKLQLAKMRMLMRRKLVEGCPCGCRGDFVLTPKGANALSTPSAEQLQERSLGLEESKLPS